MKKTRFSLLLICLTPAFLTACESPTPGSDAKRSLFSTVESSRDDCANGGHTITAGIDDNANGELETDEVDSKIIICNGLDGATGSNGTNGTDGADGADGTAGSDGTNGADGLDGQTALIATTPADASQCPDGGTVVTAGIDDNDNGTLEADEVDHTTVICNGDDAQPVQPLDQPPEGPVGQFSMTSNGGIGSTGDGGRGGEIYIAFDYGSEGGHIQVYNTGVVDTSFTVPAMTPYLGTNPLDVTADMTLALAGDNSGLTDGAYYLNTSDDVIYQVTTTAAVVDAINGNSCADANATLSADTTLCLTQKEMTGLMVAAGATLTITCDGSEVYLETANDIYNAGTITTSNPASDDAPCDLSLGSLNFFNALTGVIDLSGADRINAAASDAQDAANFYISCENYGFDQIVPTYEDFGMAFNLGTILLNGGDGDDGGDGGDIYMGAGSLVIQTGTVNSSGGMGLVSSGGAAGDMDFYSSIGTSYFSGMLLANGGAGETKGGDAGYVDIESGYLGDLISDADIEAKGGNGNAANAGAGNYIEFENYAGETLIAGSITTSGGSSVSGVGGNGGSFEINCEYDDGWGESYIPCGDIQLSAHLELSGGNGTDGGSGGEVYIELDADYTPNGQQVLLFGYTNISVNGGNGAVNGGDSGYVDLENDYGEHEGLYVFGGGVVCYADINLNGGDGATGEGGDSGYLDMESSYYYTNQTTSPVMRIISYSNVSANGGMGLTAGGSPGYIYYFGSQGVENHGSISANGGDATGASASGASCDYYGNIWFWADLAPVINTGMIVAQGGSATAGFGTGGLGAYVEFVGATVTNSGDINLAGGAGSANDGTGGNAQGVLFYSIDGQTTQTGAVSVAGGAGKVAGTEGHVLVDGVRVN